MKMKLSSIIIAATALIVGSCNFLDQEPKVICAETFYESETEVKYGLAGVYGILNSATIYGKAYSLDMSAVDDLCWFISSTSQGSETNLYTHHAGTNNIYSIWSKFYAGIKNANAFMDAVQKTEFDPDGVFYSEARFLRAYYHFLVTQAWGDVPLLDYATQTYEDTHTPATSQYDILKWVVKEIEDCLPKLTESLEHTPSRVCKTTAEGILARVYLFMAGSSVNGGIKKDLYAKAAHWAKEVIDSNLHKLNPSYSQVFINMIADMYDTEWRESMWEADFVGGPDDPTDYSCGYIGNQIGLRGRSTDTNFSEWNCGYANGVYNGSIKLWDLYWAEDRTDSETKLSTITDTRQDWNLPPYNYQGYNGSVSTGVYPYGGDPTVSKKPVANMDKNPYIIGGGLDTNHDILFYAGHRNCGKWRREAIYEGHHNTIYRTTQINFPILRYSDVLLMYAEAINEANDYPSQEAYDALKMVRDRAGIQTKDFSEYSTHSSFRELVRNERARELCFEATRKYDLIRWGILEKAIKESYMIYYSDTRCNSYDATLYAQRYATNVSAKHVLMPIPLKELGVNPLLKQNPLW